MASPYPPIPKKSKKDKGLSLTKKNNKNIDESIIDTLVTLVAHFGESNNIKKVDKILDAKLRTEYVVYESLYRGIMDELNSEGNLSPATVDYATKIMAKSRDSITDLVKVKNLLEGKPTDINLSLVERVRKARERVSRVTKDGVRLSTEGENN